MTFWWRFGIVAGVLFLAAFVLAIGALAAIAWLTMD